MFFVENVNKTAENFIIIISNINANNCVYLSQAREGVQLIQLELEGKSCISNTALGSRVMPIVLITWNAIAAFSEEYVEKLVHGVLLYFT